MATMCARLSMTFFCNISRSCLSSLSAADAHFVRILLASSWSSPSDHHYATTWWPSWDLANRLQLKVINQQNRWFIILISIFRLIVCKKNIRLHIRNTYTYLHRIVSSSLSHAILSFCILIQPSYHFLMCLCVGPTRPYLTYLCTCSTIHFILWIGFFEQTH